MKKKWIPVFTIYGVIGLIFQLVASTLFKKFGWDYDTGGIATWLFFLYPVISFPYWVLGESGIFTTWTAVHDFLVLLICGGVDLSIFSLIKLRLKKRLSRES
jgi:hypothetical protein